MSHATSSKDFAVVGAAGLCVFCRGRRILPKHKKKNTQNKTEQNKKKTNNRLLVGAAGPLAAVADLCQIPILPLLSLIIRTFSHRWRRICQKKKKRQISWAWILLVANAVVGAVVGVVVGVSSGVIVGVIVGVVGRQHWRRIRTSLRGTTSGGIHLSSDTPLT